MVDEHVVACSGCGAEWRSRDPVPPLDHCPICPVSDRELDAMIAQLEAERAAKIKSLEEEIDRLRLAIRRLAEQDATLSVCDGNVTVTMDATLTDAELDDLRVWSAECVRQANAAMDGGNEELAERWMGRAWRAAAMIERTGGGR